MLVGVQAQVLLGEADLVDTQRGAVGAGLAGLVRGAAADDGAAAHHRRSGVGQRGLDGAGDLAVVVAIDHLDMPAQGLEAGHAILGEGQPGGAVDGDAVVVVQRDEAAQLEVTGQGGGLVADAFHHVTVAAEHPGAVVAQLGAEALAQHPLGHGHADRVGEALAQGAGGGLDHADLTHLGVAGGAGAQLAEVLDLRQLEIDPGEVEQPVQQHRAVAAGQHEAVAVGPVRPGRVVAEEARPEHVGHIGHAHGQAGVSGVGLLDGVDGQAAQGVHTELIDGCHGGLRGPS